MDVAHENTCPDCGSSDMREKVRTQPMTYRGQTRQVPMPGLYCQDCGEGIHSIIEMAVSDAVLREMIAKEAQAPA